MAKSKKRYYAEEANERNGVDALNIQRRREFEDSRMINEDRNAIANLPQDVKYHEWPGDFKGYNPDLDDTQSGIDYQIKEDSKRDKKGRFPEKY